MLFHILRYISNCSFAIPHSISMPTTNISVSNKQFIKTMFSPFDRQCFFFVSLELWLNMEIICVYKTVNWNCTKIGPTDRRMSKPYTWPLYELEHYRNSLVVVCNNKKLKLMGTVSRQMVKLHATMRIIEILWSRALYAFECHRNSHEIEWHRKVIHACVGIVNGSYKQWQEEPAYIYFALIFYLLFALSFFFFPNCNTSTIWADFIFCRAFVFLR